MGTVRMVAPPHGTRAAVEGFVYDVKDGEIDAFAPHVKQLEALGYSVKTERQTVEIKPIPGDFDGTIKPENAVDQEALANLARIEAARKAKEQAAQDEADKLAAAEAAAKAEAEAKLAAAEAAAKADPVKPEADLEAAL